MELWWQTIKQFRFLSNTFPNKITVKDWTANQLCVLELAHHQKQEPDMQKVGNLGTWFPDNFGGKSGHFLEIKDLKTF